MFLQLRRSRQFATIPRQFRLFRVLFASIGNISGAALSENPSFGTIQLFLNPGGGALSWLAGQDFRRRTFFCEFVDFGAKVQ